MDFDELQKNWQAQPVNIPEADPARLEALAQKWHKQQRGVRRSNILSTIGFLAVIINFCWVYWSFHAGRSLLFGGSLLMMVAVMLVFMWVMWKGVSYNKEDMSLTSASYIDQYLQRLYWRRKTITTYKWIYAFLLWLALMLYFVDVLKGGSTLLIVGAVSGTTVYIAGVMLLTIRKSKKKLVEIDELISELQELKRNIVES